MVQAFLVPKPTPRWEDQVNKIRVQQPAILAAIAAQEAAEQAQAKQVADAAAAQAKAVYEAPTAVYHEASGALTGSIGYATPGGNCVLEVPPLERLMGNPITWPVLTQTPYIGAIALFPYNHVAVVTGLWSNGDVEVRQQNWGGVPQTRFSRGELRGFR